MCSSPPSVHPSATWSVRPLWAESVRTLGRSWRSSRRWGGSAALPDRRWGPSSTRLRRTSGPPAAGPASDAAAPPSGWRWPRPPPRRPGSPGDAAPGWDRGNSAPCRSSWPGRHAAAELLLDNDGRKKRGSVLTDEGCGKSFFVPHFFRDSPKLQQLTIRFPWCGASLSLYKLHLLHGPLSLKQKYQTLLIPASQM